MKLTRSTDYALRILIHLAKSQEPKTMRELVVSLHIPYNNVMKLVQRLSKSKLLITRQGKGGGITLGIDPKAISLLQVIQVIDGPTELSQCGNDGSHACELTELCQLKHVFSSIQSRINGIFDAVSVGEIAFDEINLQVVKG